MSEIIKNKEGRYETKEGLWLSSPSRILKPLTLEKYQDIPIWQLEKAGDFGREIHEAVEIYHKLENDETEARKLLYTKRHEQTFNQYLEWLKEFNVKVLQVEKLIYNQEQRYFGFIDLVCEIDGVLHIVDLKTRSNLKSEDEWLCEKLQLELYRMAFESNNELTEWLTEHLHKEDTRKIETSILVINKNTKNMRLFKTTTMSNTEHKILTSLLDLHINKLKRKEG